MNIAVLTVAYSPLKSSAAIQMKAIAEAFARAGHQPYVFFPDSTIFEDYKIEIENGVVILRFKCPESRDKNYVIRTINEFVMPYLIWRKFLKYQARTLKIEFIVCYSPSIFFGPLVRRLKAKYNCRAYLILRDIFPAWAVDLNLIKRDGVIHRIFSFVEKELYRLFEVIGVQSEGNLTYFENRKKFQQKKIEVLNNWYSPLPYTPCSIDIKSTKLRGKNIFIYAGNLGVAQSPETLLTLMVAFRDNKTVGFVFVGRGSEFTSLIEKANKLKLDNVLFYPEIPPEEIAALYDQCDIGLICLDARHQTQNIPGKFVSYMHSGLPVLAMVNPGNDLFDLITTRNVGIAIEAGTEKYLRFEGERALKLLSDKFLSARCKKLANDKFSSENAVKQIMDSLVDK